MKRMIAALMMAATVTACGGLDFDDEKKDKVCYACTYDAYGRWASQRSYACTAQEAIQFSRPCNNR